MNEDITTKIFIDPRTRTRPLRLHPCPKAKAPTHPQLLCKAFKAGLYRLNQSLRINDAQGVPWAKDVLKAGQFFWIRHLPVDGIRWPHLQPFSGGGWITGQRVPRLFVELVPHLSRLSDAEGLRVLLRGLGLDAQDLLAVLLLEGATWRQLQNLLEVALHHRSSRCPEGRREKAKRARQSQITQPQRPAA